MKRTERSNAWPETPEGSPIDLRQNESEVGLEGLLTLRGARKSVMTPKEVVRWLLQFTKLDLDVLSVAEFEKICWEATSIIGNPDAVTISKSHIRECQREARKQLDGYYDHETGWKYEVTLSGSVHWSEGGKLIMHGVYGPEGNDSLPKLFMWHVLVAMLHAGRAFKRCANLDCRRPFVADGRQTYCTRLCSDRVRMAKYLNALKQDPKRKEKALARRQKAYAQKQKAKYGARVKVGRQRS